MASIVTVGLDSSARVAGGIIVGSILSSRLFLAGTHVIDKPKSIYQLDDPHSSPITVFVVYVCSLYMSAGPDTLKDVSEGCPEVWVMTSGG